MGNTFASEGGFCVGEEAVVDHQRLSGAGYCFSASLPPFLARASIEAINKLDSNPALLQKLQKNVEIMRQSLTQGMDKRMRVDGTKFSPVFHIRFASGRDHRKAENPEAVRLENDKILQEVVEGALLQGVAVTRSKYSTDEKFMPESSIRITVTSMHTEDQIAKATSILKSVIASTLNDHRCK